MKIESSVFRNKNRLRAYVKNGTPNFHLRRNPHKIPRGKILLPVFAFALAIAGVIGVSGKIWADHTGMTEIFFSSNIFCQQVSVSVAQSLGQGKVDGGDCANHHLYISSDEIVNVKALAITPEPGEYDDLVDPIDIGGNWVQILWNLTSLTINNMPITDITNLKNLRGNLTYLDLANNRISDLNPLKESSEIKSSLTYLDLSENSVGGDLRPLSRLEQLTTLKLVNTDTSSFEELFAPPETEIVYDEETGEPIKIVDQETGEWWPAVVNPETGEVSGGPTVSKLAEKLQILDVDKNEGISSDIAEDTEEEEQICTGNFQPFEKYAKDLVLTELYAVGDNLNTNDLRCIANLRHLDKLDVSENHIEDFSSIKNKTYSSLNARSQVFKRTVAGLDYNLSQTLFSQAGVEDYFSRMTDAHNTAVTLEQMDKINAELNGRQVRFIDAVIASTTQDDPQPATIMVPSGSGVFEGSRLEVYFSGQIVTFNDTNLCNSVYYQGATGSAFYDAKGNPTRSSEDPPVVLTNACNTRKQIAMISGGSSSFLRLSLDGVNSGAEVDLTGLQDFDSLQLLSLKDNSLTDISALSNANNLQQLSLDNNKLGSDDWWVITDNLTNLGILSLNNNNMSEISQSVENLTSLGELNLVNNGISDVSPLAYIPSLTSLDLSENRGLTDFSGLVQDDSACDPWILKIENAGITRMPSTDAIQSGFPHLRSLALNGNQITDETIANLSKATKLQELYLDDNKIGSSSVFSGVTSLKTLSLEGNLLTEAGGFKSLTALTKLQLGRNQISDLVDLNATPALDTLSIKNQTLSGSTSDPEATFTLPAVFSQAKTMSFPKVSGFNSAGDYVVTNGTINYDTMTVTMTNTSEPATVTIPDGGLAGTVLTINYESEDFAGNIIDRTNGGATVTSTSRVSFIVTSDTPCIIAYSKDEGATWTRIISSPVPGDDKSRSFSLDQPDGADVVVAYAGDVEGTPGTVDVFDARKIVNSIMEKDSLSNLEKQLADVEDAPGTVDVFDARTIVNSIMGKTTINW